LSREEILLNQGSTVGEASRKKRELKELEEKTGWKPSP